MQNTYILLFWRLPRIPYFRGRAKVQTSFNFQPNVMNFIDKIIRAGNWYVYILFTMTAWWWTVEF